MAAEVRRDVEVLTGFFLSIAGGERFFGKLRLKWKLRLMLTLGWLKEVALFKC